LRPTRIRDDEMKNKLKLIAMLFCMIGLVTLTSCTKEENDGLIVGTWRCTYSAESSSGFHWTFQSDGTFITDDPIDVFCGEETSYRVRGSKLILGGYVYYTIDKLTETELEVTSFFDDEYHFVKQ
jgi:hypothetical protein